MRSPTWIALLFSARAVMASEVGCPAEVEFPAALATYYEPTAEGACSLPTPPGTLYAAIASIDYAGSELCGRCARVTGPDGAITVQIVDECASLECGAGHLDLRGEATFAAIADPLLGVVPISWETVACDVGDTNMQLQFEGSHAYYLKVQVQNHRYGVATVEMQDGASWISLGRTLDDHFERLTGGPFDEPFVFRITSVHGEAVVSNGVALANDVPIDAGVQFVPCPEPPPMAGALALAALAGLARRRGQGAAADCTTASSSAP